ncbi:hypothetical protein HGRIS_006560 [Hohenbuehelia grisea]|uniref:Uncharacterized protein n=1 Tax=Hohenbuehelia grisea TaxID=104357 RepID=A0ABR3JAU7_9AGAR
MSSAAMGAGSAEVGERTSEDQGLSESGGEKGGEAGHAVVSQSQSHADPIDPEARISLEKHSRKDSEDASRKSDEDDAMSDRTTDVDDDEGSVYSHASTSGLDALQARFNSLSGDVGYNLFDDMSLRGHSCLLMLAAQACRAHAASSTSSSSDEDSEASQFDGSTILGGIHIGYGVACSPTLGGAASALRQRIEAQAAARARAGSDVGQGRIDGDIPNSLGGRIVVENDDPAPDVSLTTTKMGLGASADDSVLTEDSGMDPETSAISAYSQDPDSSVATVQGVESKPVDAFDAEEIDLSLDALSSAVEST